MMCMCVSTVCTRPSEELCERFLRLEFIESTHLHINYVQTTTFQNICLKVSPKGFSASQWTFGFTQQHRNEILLKNEKTRHLILIKEYFITLYVRNSFFNFHCLFYSNISISAALTSPVSFPDQF